MGRAKIGLVEGSVEAAVLFEGPVSAHCFGKEDGEDFEANVIDFDSGRRGLVKEMRKECIRRLEEFVVAQVGVTRNHMLQVDAAVLEGGGVG